MTALNLYEKDFYAWTQEQVKLIKKNTLDKLDIKHLCEELQIMGAREKSELRNRLRVLLMHLLKWQYQPNYINRKSWQFTIEEQRDELIELLNDNPSLKYKIDEILPKAYKRAYREAIIETGLPDEYFPKSCPWSLEQILSEDFFLLNSAKKSLRSMNQWGTSSSTSLNNYINKCHRIT